MDLSDKKSQAVAILEETIAVYQPVAIFGLFSGGHDSYTVTHFCAGVLGDRLDGVAHINTGIGIRQTREFVRERCKAHGWKLLEYKAAENVKADGTPDPQIYEELVVKHGFPGPPGHGLMYNKLKQRQVRRLVRDHKTKRMDRIMLISGCRKEESSRRMGTSKPVTKEGAQVWVNPFTDWTGAECAAYMREQALPENPVKKYLCMSGECLCGAFAKKGELQMIRDFYPEAAAEIDRIQARVFEAGHTWGWEDRPPKGYDSRQEDMFMPLCVRCTSTFEQEERDQ